ncbi:hypothetical protein EPTV-WA-176 [Eptesipox virus]|uniref:Uncharacterized protein n=1 Tax=Eptesipox virus TaxID=1329402 RepID=A0A220T6N9_9POXV|nr:hypothetical protein CG743_gp176 [Eptesipox virus]ASK51377.1 hypothetical protein EPTV-WA-176 [Eptesipox virus]WAH71135.1 hypothetical protein CG743_gp176 [Eptesipox virus]
MFNNSVYRSLTVFITLYTKILLICYKLYNFYKNIIFLICYNYIIYKNIIFKYETYTNNYIYV